ncbi:MAG: phosphohistidine phosphatase SixA [Chloroflexota bacterium]|nr:MAG: phosphohistidine phosphatase SixA [Chloroflexota bacterium]
MILYFLRHGLAGNRSEWEGDDRLRPLTKKGKDQLEASARLMDKLELGLDLIITSPLVRSRQTAEVVAEGLDMARKMVEDERLSPGFGLDALAEIVKERCDLGAIMLVGHEPDFSETIQELTGGRVVCKKGSLARIDLTSEEPPQGVLVWLLQPKVLAV